MVFESDNTALSGAQAPALADVVISVGEKLDAALAHSSHAAQFESRRLIEQMLGRKLEPLFALELLTLLLAPGNEARELRAAFVRLMSMTETTEWLESMTASAVAPAGSDAADTPDAAAAFVVSEAAASAQELARCGECLARCAEEREVEKLTREAAAARQWARCAQCRCGTAAWLPRR